MWYFGRKAQPKLERGFIFKNLQSGTHQTEHEIAYFHLRNGLVDPLWDIKGRDYYKYFYILFMLVWVYSNHVSECPMRKAYFQLIFL